MDQRCLSADARSPNDDPLASTAAARAGRIVQGPDRVAHWLPVGGPPVDWLVEPSGCGAGRIGDGSPASAGDSWTRCDRIYGTDPYATVLPSTVRRRGVRPATTARRAAT